MNRFADRVALVTGAAGGIGRATAERLLAEGAQVMGADLADGAAGTSSLVLDVTSPESCEAAVEAVVGRFGRLDVLVNCAGIGAFGLTPDLGLDEWNRVLQVNLTGTFLMCQKAIPALSKQGGSIVNMASISGIRGVPYNAAYCASKGGVVLLTRSLAIELGRAGVRVNCVCPAAVDTPLLTSFAFPEGADMTLFARGTPVLEGVIPPEKIAAAVAYLASDEASFVTGVPFLVDGGSFA